MSQSLDGRYELIPQVRFVIGLIALIGTLTIFFVPEGVDNFKRLAMIISPLCMGILISPHLGIWRKRSS